LFGLFNCAGLNVGGILPFLKKAGLAGQHLFSHQLTVDSLTAAKFESMMNICLDDEEGSNGRRFQEAIARSWIYFLRATES